MEMVIILLTAAALFGLFRTIRTTYVLSRGLEDYPLMGRILFRGLLSLKIWAALILVYFFVNTFWPNFFEGYRLPIRLLLGGYLVVQTFLVDLAYHRWYKE